MSATGNSQTRFLPRDAVSTFIEALRREHQLVGPTPRDGALRLGPISRMEDLPIGLRDRQAPGHFRLEKRDDAALFGYTVPVDSLKNFLFPAEEKLYQATRRPDGRIGFAPIRAESEPVAFLGVRSCDLSAANVQDEVFLRNGFREPRYAERRKRALIVAVNCTEAGDLCFCTSVGGSPRVGEGADVVITELEEGLLLESHTDRGAAIVESLSTNDPTPEQTGRADERIRNAEVTMEKRLPEVDRLAGRLLAELDHARYDEVAERCLACGNCTNVCPTCFCSDTLLHSDFSGDHVECEKRWDSCFTRGHAAVVGGNHRPAIRDRYRQWLTHKLSTWVGQFGTSGCVGCGRCIAWCPVGIDLTEEARAIAESEGPLRSQPRHVSSSVADDDLVPRGRAIEDARRETSDVTTLRIECKGPTPAPGQFYMLSLPAIGEAALSVSRIEPKAVEHTIRGVGPLTDALIRLRAGDSLGVRGPYGMPWPLERAERKPLVLVAGGIGLAPLRPVLEAAARQPATYPLVRLFYGARSPADQLYTAELRELEQSGRCEVRCTVDRAPAGYRGHLGPVTRLLDANLLPRDALYLMCGPELMMKLVAKRLLDVGVAPERIHLSMERHMKCATGFCGRCQLGPWFLCKDGPVFAYDAVAPWLGRHGF